MWVYRVYGHDSKLVNQFARTVQETIPAVEAFIIADSGSLTFKPGKSAQLWASGGEHIVCVAPSTWLFVTVQWEEGKNVVGQPHHSPP